MSRESFRDQKDLLSILTLAYCWSAFTPILCLTKGGSTGYLKRAQWPFVQPLLQLHFSFWVHWVILSNENWEAAEWMYAQRLEKVSLIRQFGLKLWWNKTILFYVTCAFLFIFVNNHRVPFNFLPFLFQHGYLRLPLHTPPKLTSGTSLVPQQGQDPSEASHPSPKQFCLERTELEHILGGVRRGWGGGGWLSVSPLWWHCSTACGSSCVS